MPNQCFPDGSRFLSGPDEIIWDDEYQVDYYIGCKFNEGLNMPEETSGWWGPSDSAERIKEWLKIYTVDELFEAVDETAKIYLKPGWDGPDANAAKDAAFRKIPGLADIAIKTKVMPEYRRYVYIQGVVRRRCDNKKIKIVELIHTAHQAGADLDWIEREAKRLVLFKDFAEKLQAFLPEDAEA